MTSAEVVRQTPQQKTLAKLITDMTPELAKALPRHVTPERMARIAVTVVRATPKLAECSPASFLGALLTASQLGLEPGPTGEAYFVPYKQTCTFIPGYRGLIKLARQSGQVSDIYAEIVYANDKFKVTRGLQRNIEHEEAADRNNRGKPTDVYAVAKFKDGTTTFVTMTVNEVEAIRRRSMAANNGPWVTDWEAMAKKTAVRQLSKWLPLSAEFNSAVSLDGTVRTDVGPLVDAQTEFIDGEVVPSGQPEIAASAETPADDPQMVDGEPTQIRMATKAQLTRLAQIQKSEKYDSDDEWFSYLGDAAGVKARRTADVTYDEAAAVISLFDGPEQ
ncbi:recombinase RecT [Mycobacterium dioxanotrophicus]|uniref:recombinase RecT n=1 Tax=Mycobacterium dioxanotrophicus TaxID=482462 RepID=UPI0012FC9E28|nr:recombinase RecT [Mycobacterium dioxanotrophicus]